MSVTVPAPPAPGPGSVGVHAPTQSGAPRSSAAPLGAVLAFTFFNSVGGGVVTTGFSFLADSAYGFSPAQNYFLGLLQGIVYVAAALAAGPALHWAIRRVPGLSTRRTLVLIMLLLGAFCTLPWLARGTSGGGAWALWLLIGGYSALTGVLWPITESYMSGGRSEARLRSATGAFNVVWSSALVVSFWIMGPLKQHHSLELVLGVGILHLACAGLLVAFTPNPAAHVHEHHAPAPESYPRFLGVFRVQLVTSYMVFSALTPFLPVACKSLQISEHLQTPVAATWLASRVVAFALMQRWHGWHGRWATAFVGAVLLLAGFGVAVMSPSIAAATGRPTGVVALVAGLAAFGLGMGAIYFAALYYAMSVGNAQVDAGGKHEAMIGLGYGGGPVFGLLAIYSVSAAPGSTGTGNFQTLMLMFVATVSVGLIGWSLWRARRHANRTH